MDAILVAALVLATAIVLLLIRGMVAASRIATYTPDEAVLRIRRGEALVLDIGDGLLSLPGILHIPFAELESRLWELEAYRQQVIICVCDKGRWSTSAAMRLREHGFDVAHLCGGLEALAVGVLSHGRRAA